MHLFCLHMYFTYHPDMLAHTNATPNLTSTHTWYGFASFCVSCVLGAVPVPLSMVLTLPRARFHWGADKAKSAACLHLILTHDGPQML